jgi:hypothetical protein
VVAVKGTPLISEPKTKAGLRTVYLSGRTIEASRTNGSARRPIRSWSGAPVRTRGSSSL